MENTPEQWYKNLPIVTRVGITTMFVTTVLVQLEILNPKLIFLDWPLVINKLQIWRLLTSVCFNGTFSFNFLIQMYFFSSFGSKLEQNEIFNLPGDYLFFLIVQILLLDVFSLVMAWPTGFPMLGHPFIFAVMYYWSRREPYAMLSFFGFSIKGYQFPFFMLLFQVLMGGSIWTDLLGLASGHTYYFLKEVVPQEYGLTLIKTPAFLHPLMQAGGARGNAGAAQPGAPRPPPRFDGAGQRLGGT